VKFTYLLRFTPLSLFLTSLFLEKIVQFSYMYTIDHICPSSLFPFTLSPTTSTLPRVLHMCRTIKLIFLSEYPMLSLDYTTNILASDIQLLNFPWVYYTPALFLHCCLCPLLNYVLFPGLPITEGWKLSQNRDANTGLSCVLMCEYMY
jgi:uncharacterized membrane protein YwaF